MPTGSFEATLTAIGSLALMAGVGYWSRRRNWLTHQGVADLARLLVDFLLPGALFHTMVTQFSRDKAATLLVAGGAQLGLFAVGAGLAYAAHRALRLREPAGTVAVMSSMQNNVYIPFPLATALLPAAMAAEAHLIIACFVLFFNPLLWSVGYVLLTGGLQGEGLRGAVRKTLNPPFLATCVGMVLSLALGLTNTQVPGVVLEFTKFCKDCTAPMAIVLLGAVMAEARWTRSADWKAVSVIAVIKLLMLPAMMMAVLHFAGPVPAVLAFVLMAEAASPPATNITLLLKRTDNDAEFVAIAMVVSYLLCLLTLPLWMMLL